MATHHTNNTQHASCMMGDFGQLSPISENNNPIRLAFQSTIWHKLATKTFVLSNPHNGILYIQKIRSTVISTPTRNVTTILHTYMRI